MGFNFPIGKHESSLQSTSTFS